MTVGNVAVLVATTTIVIRIAGLPMVPSPSGGIDRGQDDNRKLHRESISALRAKAQRGFGPHRI
jgi:hypothetical protein